MRTAIYVCADPGVPAFGRKGCSNHVQSVLRELTARAGNVHLVACRTGGDAPADLASVHVHELGRPREPDAAATERAMVGLDAVACSTVLDIVGRTPTSAAPAVVVQRYSLWSCEVMEAVGDRVDAVGLLELNAPLVDEQSEHRTLIDRHTATARTRRAVRSADRRYAVSSAVARWAEQLAGAPVDVVPNGVDIDRFAVPRSTVERPFTVVFVGTFRPWHGLDELTEAVAMLAAGGRTIRLLLVGDGPARDATVDRARRAGVDVEVAGAVDPTEVPTLLARADVAVAPYPVGDHYFSPLKVAEYLAAALPTIAAAVGDLPTLYDGDEVLLVPAGDGPALGAALGRLHDDRTLRRRLSHHGALAARRHTWTSVVDRILAPVPGWSDR